MKKVATLSYQHAYNYGAVFQVAALQHIISELGYDCNIIDYRCEGIDCQYALSPIRLDRHIIQNLRANLILLPFINKKKQNFQEWMSAYKATRPLKREELPTIADRYDKFVVGSDQVWNLKCNGNDTSFFLDFVEPHKRIAYAASIGFYDIPEEYKTAFEKYLPTFKSISAREDRAAELIEVATGRKCPVCMDPVFAVGKQYWEERMTKTTLMKEPYIFVYQLGHSNQIPKFVKCLKKKMGLKIVFVTGHIGNMVYYSLADKNMSSASPQDFLSLLAKAEYVVSNSFHATVLSLLFNKQFAVVNAGGSKAATNSRLYSLLQDFNLTSRIVGSYSDEMLTEIDYTNFDDTYEYKVKYSLEYLKEALSC